MSAGALFTPHGPFLGTWWARGLETRPSVLLLPLVIPSPLFPFRGYWNNLGILILSFVSYLVIFSRRISRCYLLIWYHFKQCFLVRSSAQVLRFCPKGAKLSLVADGTLAAPPPLRRVPLVLLLVTVLHGGLSLRA